MKKHLTILAILTCCCISFACNKKEIADNSTQQKDADNYDLILSDENEEWLAMSGSDPIPLNRVIDADGNRLGKSTQTEKEDVIYKMIAKGLTLCFEKSNKIYPYEGEHSPEQQGLAYSYGQRNPYSRLLPPYGSLIHKQDFVYGLDCSGLMYIITKEAGIDLTPSVTTGDFLGCLSKGVKEASTSTNIMGVLDLGKISKSEFKAGDFILWPGHVGMICITDDGKQHVIQSNGKGYPQSEEAQKLNRGPNRGVHTIEVDKALSKSWFNDNYKILRIVNAGEVMFGGYLFSIDEGNKTGLVCALEDQMRNVQLPDIYTPGTSTEYGEGLANTKLLINALGSNNPIGSCYNLESGGYKDWYLPSRDELLKMIAKLKYNEMGNISEDPYWSSSDKAESWTSAGTYYPSTAYCVYFNRAQGEAIGLSDFKNKQCNVRAVRKFEIGK